jgi:hypothetical protein
MLFNALPQTTIVNWPTLRHLSLGQALIRPLSPEICILYSPMQLQVYVHRKQLKPPKLFPHNNLCQCTTRLTLRQLISHSCLSNLANYSLFWHCVHTLLALLPPRTSYSLIRRTIPPAPSPPFSRAYFLVNAASAAARDCSPRRASEHNHSPAAAGAPHCQLQLV